VSNIFSHEVTPFFTSSSFVNQSPVRCFLKGPKRWQSLGPVLPTGLVTD